MLPIRKIRRDLQKRVDFKAKQLYILKLKAFIHNSYLSKDIKNLNRQLLRHFVRKHGIFQTQILNKCLVTGRSRGVIHEFGLSRIVFKKLVDQGDLY